MTKLYVYKNQNQYIDYAYVEPRDNCIEIPYFADRYSNICDIYVFRYHISENGNFKTLHCPYILFDINRKIFDLNFISFVNDGVKLSARKFKNIKIISLNKELSFLMKEIPTSEIFEKIKEKKNEIKIATSNAYREFTKDFISNSKEIQNMFNKFGKPNFDFEQALYNEIHYGYTVELFTNRVRIISIFD